MRAGPSDPADCKIVAALTSLARGLGLHVVAEGVETHEQLSFVTDCGCNEAQGFLLGRPLTSAGFVEFAKALENKKGRSKVRCGLVRNRALSSCSLSRTAPAVRCRA